MNRADPTQWRSHSTDYYLPEQWDPEWDPSVYLSGAQSGVGRRVIFDLEGDGLLLREPKRDIKRISQLWCIGAIDIDTREKFYWGVDLGPDSLTAGVLFLSEVDLALAHNGIRFDYPALERLYPWTYKRPAKAWDTMVMAKVVWPYDVLIGPDMARIKTGRMPPRLLKSQSLEAWGYRTGTHKVDYQGGFEEWCPAMATYLMTGDLDGPMALWELIQKRTSEWERPEFTFEYENEVARIIFEQEEDGVRFDTEKAIALAAELKNEQARLEARLVEAFGSWWQPLDDPAKGTPWARTAKRKMVEHPDVTLRRYSEKTGKELKSYVGPPLETAEKGEPFVRIEWTTFNPGSRDHLGMRLQDVFGWRPKKFGKDRKLPDGTILKGKPTVDESVLGEIPDSVMPVELRQDILDYFVVTKTLGTLSKGQKAWLKLAEGNPDNLDLRPAGRIYGTMDTCGAVTRRGTHKNPNLSGTPAVRKEKVVLEDGSKAERVLRGLKGRYGWECRELFVADEGWEQTGVDASALELIVLGHYLWRYDNGAFSDRVCDPSRDPHQEHAEITGTSRADAKTAIYLKVYGGSAFKLSLDPAIIVTPDHVPELLGYRGLPMMLSNLEKRMGPEFVRNLDDMQKARIARARQIIIALEAGIPGLKELTEDVTRAAAKGWLKGLDGSRIHVRKDYAALNSILQSGGAMTCKVWDMLTHRDFAAQGLRRGRDLKQVLWLHDEYQYTHRPGLGPLIKEVAERNIVKTGEMLGLRGRFRSDAKHGINWAACH